MSNQETEQSAELVIDEPYTPSRVVGGIPYFEQYLMLADRISRTAMVPTASRGKPDEVLAIVMYSAELGIGPMQALQQINFIEGKPSLAPELMRALIRQAGHKLNIQSTRTQCVIVGERGDTGEVGETEFTLDDAVLAGLCTVDSDGRVRSRSSQGKALPWEKYTKDMLLARATSRMARMMFSDVISGMSYTPEEVISFSEPTSQVAEPKELATEVMQRQIKDGLEQLYPDERKAFALWWQDSGITRGVQNLSVTEADSVWECLFMILNASDGIVEAEVVEPTQGNLEPSEVIVEAFGDVEEVHTGESNTKVTAPSITQPQMGKIRAMLGKGSDVEAKVSEILKRPVSGLSQLTKAEATHVIDNLIADVNV